LLLLEVTLREQELEHFSCVPFSVTVLLAVILRHVPCSFALWRVHGGTTADHSRAGHTVRAAAGHTAATLGLSAQARVAPAPLACSQAAAVGALRLLRYRLVAVAAVVAEAVARTGLVAAPVAQMLGLLGAVALASKYCKEAACGFSLLQAE
jgi:hypothetical protein